MVDEYVLDTSHACAVQEAIMVLVRFNATAAERLWALQDLQVLVEPIDNANGA